MTDLQTAPAAIAPIVAFAGTDTASAIRDLAGLYAGRAWHASHIDSGYWYKYVAVGDDRMSIHRFQMHGYLRGDVTVEDEVVVQWIDAGRGRVDVGRNEVQLQHRIPTLFPIEQRFEMEYEDWDQRLVHLSRDLVLDVAAERYLTDGTIAFDRSVAPTTDAVLQWRRSVASAMHALRSVGPSSMAWHEAQRDVARSLFGLYPFQGETLPEGFGDRKNARLRAAVEFIHQHAAEPLTVSDIAYAAGISVRSLQESFQRELDVAPMNYLREVRLRHVHADLLEADQDVTTVAEIASKWGFGHMGRFSHEYLNEFGEYPKHTLRR
ncbi:helix-turn-helix transcriptional regulator [Curtobacterium sp. ISL-83]|uniref:helix-turn-helix transcriptional regulator n=1 Tax=Curtobacterium sp. ISL-83 TaxID=2819145 RepID=UPI001BED2274|nr:helix-turn-helix transcriptional regulator [Curtobacterium sp. ISL-83]MBT2501669.1 helix-turn-helix transcriptional regulator [Curtobacterium sp. ISL-83]